jgi:DNA-binding PadR family transcriptional regulator
MALEHTLLGLLILMPRTGYDLHKRMERATFLLESASLRRIYPTLKRLAQDGLVEYRVEPQEGKPDRKIYSVTDEGEAVFIAWLREPPPADGPDLDRLFARFFFYGMLDRDTILSHLEPVLEQRRALLAGLRGFHLDPPGGPCRPIVDDDRVLLTWNEMLDYARADLATQIEWLEKTIEHLKIELTD